MLTFGSLFAGIGGFDLGFERVGFHCEWQVEIKDFNREVLARTWPGAIHGADVREFKPTAVDLVCGGFPCQDISNAGKRAGISGERSGLWGEFLRIIREIRPEWVRCGLPREQVWAVMAFAGSGQGRAITTPIWKTSSHG